MHRIRPSSASVARPMQASASDCSGRPHPVLKRERWIPASRGRDRGDHEGGRRCSGTHRSRSCRPGLVLGGDLRLGEVELHQHAVGAYHWALRCRVSRTLPPSRSAMRPQLALESYHRLRDRRGRVADDLPSAARRIRAWFAAARPGRPRGDRARESKAASVLPEPVRAETSTFSPRAIAGPGLRLGLGRSLERAAKPLPVLLHL
jgi:hypothetical protein